MTDHPREHLRIALAQLNPMMGDIMGNMAKIRAARAEAAKAGADIVLFPELFICGYPPEDLVMKPALQDACRDAIEGFAPETGDGGPGVLLGTRSCTALAQLGSLVGQLVESGEKHSRNPYPPNRSRG